MLFSPSQMVDKLPTCPKKQKTVAATTGAIDTARVAATVRLHYAMTGEVISPLAPYRYTVLQSVQKPGFLTQTSALFLSI
jgi:hypothetical protein